MIYRGHVKEGIIILDPPGRLPEGTEVIVEAIAKPADERDEVDNPLLQMLELAGPTGIPDLGAHDTV
jgi:hypothetical protein